MTSYFDEHDCEELGAGQQPDHMMHFARLLIDTGAWNEAEFSAMFNDRPPPPTSAKFLDELEDKLLRCDLEGEKCPVCLKGLEEEDVINRLPCKHQFHKECIVPWLQKTCSCPVCRHQLPTDDKAFEEMRRQKKREKERQFDIENLHNSMFG